MPLCSFSLSLLIAFQQAYEASLRGLLREQVSLLIFNVPYNKRQMGIRQRQISITDPDPTEIADYPVRHQQKLVKSAAGGKGEVDSIMKVRQHDCLCQR